MPKVQEQVIARFSELEKQMRAIPLIKRGEHQSRKADDEQFYAWASSALHAIRSVFGEDSPHYRHFQSQMSIAAGKIVYEMILSATKGIFLGAKSDVDGGHLFHLQATLTGEIFGDLVTSAKAALAEDQHAVATLLACAALEDALKRYATLNGLIVDDQDMESVINALKGKGLVSGPQKGLLGSMPKIRNYAMHAQWDKLKPEDAGSVIGFVEQFLLSHFT